MVHQIIEDPIFQASHVSQWVQMADLVAWSAYQSLNPNPGATFARSWYYDYLRAKDVNGGPLAIQAQKKADPLIHVCGAGPHE